LKEFKKVELNQILTIKFYVKMENSFGVTETKPQCLLSQWSEEVIVAVKRLANIDGGFGFSESCRASRSQLANS
jgi:hypothetical protein